MKRRSSSTLSKQAFQPVSPTPSLPSPRRKQRRHIKFSRQVQIREIDRICLPEEVNATWWSDDDYDDFAIENRKMIERMENPKIYRTLLELDNHNDTFDLDDTVRGLEYQIPIAAQRRMNLRCDAVTAVLQEQESQRLEEGITDSNKDENDEDDVRIAEAYIKIVSKCRETALVIGLRDARIAQQQQQQEQEEEQDAAMEKQHEQVEDERSVRSQRSTYSQHRPSFSRRGSLELRRSPTTASTTRTDYRSQRERYLRAYQPKSKPPASSSKSSRRRSSTGSTTRRRTTTTTVSTSTALE